MEMLSALTQEDLIVNSSAYDYFMRIGVDDGWESKNKSSNFLNLIKIADLSGTSLKDSSCLDVGCGTGDFTPFLRRREVRSYTGIDVFGPVVVLAQRKYPDAEFIAGDFLTTSLPGEYDFSFMSGALTLALSSDMNSFARAMISKLSRLTRAGFSFNFLTDDDPLAGNCTSVRFYSIEYMRQLCQQICPSSEVIALKDDGKFQAHVYVVKSTTKV